MNTIMNRNLKEKAMRKMGNVVLVLSMGLLAGGNAGWAAGAGTSGAQFLEIGVGARASGMGGAFGSVADDASAMYYNPAGLAQLEKREVTATYNAYFRDTAAQYIGYAHPTAEHGSFGVAADLFGVKNIEQRSATLGDSDTPDGGTFSTQDMALSLGWADKRAMMSGRLNYGAALKFIRSNLHTDKASTAALDFGGLYNMHEDMSGLSVSFAVTNLGGKLKFNSEGDPLPLDVKPGLSYRQDLGRFGKLTGALDTDLYVHDKRAYVEPGLEWWPVQMFALRGGYQFGRSDGAGSGFGVGAGFRLMGLGIDYAFVPYGDLGDSHRITLGYKF